MSPSINPSNPLDDLVLDWIHDDLKNKRVKFRVVRHDITPPYADYPIIPDERLTVICTIHWRKAAAWVRPVPDYLESERVRALTEAHIRAYVHCLREVALYDGYPLYIDRHLQFNREEIVPVPPPQRKTPVKEETGYYGRRL